MIFRRSVSDAQRASDEGDPTPSASETPTAEHPVVEPEGDDPTTAHAPVEAQQPGDDVPETTTAAETDAEAGTAPEQHGQNEPEPDATTVLEPGTESEPGQDGEPEQEATTVLAAEAGPEPEPRAPETDPEPTGVREPDATTVLGADDPEATVVRDPATPGHPDDPADPASTLEVEEHGAAPADDGGRTRRRRRRRRVLIGVGVGLVVVAGGYVAAAAYLGDRVPQGTSVAGVDLSGLPVAEAESTLQTQLADVVVAGIPVTVGDATATLDPEAAGLTLDVPATVDEFTGFTLDPRVVLGHLFGLGEQEPVVEVDEDALRQVLTETAEEVDLAPVDGAIGFEGTTASVVTPPADGVAIDVPAAVETLPTAWLTAAQPIELPTVVTTPEIDQAAVDAAIADVAEPLLSAPVTVQLSDTATTELSPEQLAAAAALVPQGSALALELDGEALAQTITRAVPDIGETAKDAQIVLEDGAPVVVPAVTGTGLDPAQLADVVAVAAVAADDDRVAVAELATTEPDLTTAEAEELGVVEVVAEFSTPMPYDPVRTQNLVTGTAHITGTVVMPGDTFSLLEALGPITAANGFVSSGVVENGFATQAMGGGLSQLSTTTFNAAFEAGMEDITHKPHSRWFDRYPAGREATLFSPSLDMQWGNNSPYAVLVQAWVSDGRTHVTLWSTPYWDVDISSSEKYAYTSPRTVYNDDPECKPESGGSSGFSIDVDRTVALDGTVNDEFSRSYSWTYSPWNTVVCGDPPSPDDDPSPSPSDD